MFGYEALAAKTEARECHYMACLRSVVAEEVNGRRCGKIVITGEPVFEKGLSFVLPKGSNLTDQLSVATETILLKHSIPNLREYNSRRGDCSLHDSTSLSFRRLYIFFIMAYGACLLIFAEMILDPQTTIHKSDGSDIEEAVSSKTQKIAIGASLGRYEFTDPDDGCSNAFPDGLSGGPVSEK